METTKILFRINGWIIGIMLLLYLTLWGGVLMQILLGIVQVGCYIYLLSNYQGYKSSIRTHLLIYGILTTSLLSLLFVSNGDLILGVWIGSVPLIVYFMYILHQTKKVL